MEGSTNKAGLFIRTVTRLVAALGVAAIVNLLVAWACALQTPTGTTDNSTVWVGDVSWSCRVERRFGFERILLESHSWFDQGVVGPTPDNVVLPRLEANGVSAINKLYVRAGWPIKSFRAQATQERPLSPHEGGGVTLSVARWKCGIPLTDDTLFTARALPCMPVGWGLAANTVLYSSVLLCAAYAPGFVRRSLKKSKGCPICKYDLRANTSGRCPECGADWRRAEK